MAEQLALPWLLAHTWALRSFVLQSVQLQSRENPSWRKDAQAGGSGATISRLWKSRGTGLGARRLSGQAYTIWLGGRYGARGKDAPYNPQIAGYEGSLEESG